MKFFARYVSNAAVILQNRDRLDDSCCFKFSFTNLTVGMKNAESKNFDKLNNIALEFIAEGDFESKEKFLETSKCNIEIILSLIALSTIRSCSSAQLTNVTEVIDPTAPSPTTYYLDFFGSNTHHEIIRFFDAKTFEEFFTRYNAYPDPNLILRAISWFRKGLEEKDINKFVTFWFGLEVLKEISPTPDNKWGKIEKIFENELNNHDFSHIREYLKEGLFNGTQPLLPIYVEEIKDNIILLQKALFIGISEELGIKKEVLNNIVQSIRVEGDQNDLYLVLIGTLKNFPSSLDYLMNSYPIIEMKTKNNPLPSISQKFQKYSFNSEFIFTNFQNSEFLMSERQVWSKQRMTDSEKQLSSIRLKDFKPDTLKISFDVGKQKDNNNEKSVVFKPWKKFLNTGSSAGKISYLFLAERKNERENLHLFGALCYSPAGHILFYPGFEYEYLTRFNSSLEKLPKSFYIIDHLTLLKGAKQSHFTGFDADGERKHNPNFDTKKIANGLCYWFGLNIRREVYFENVCKENVLKYSCPSPIIDRIKDGITKSRLDCDDYIFCPVDARSDTAGAFYHFDFFYLEGNISPIYPLDSYLIPNELVKPRKLSDTLPVKYTEIKIPTFDGKIIIASTIVSGDLSDLVILTVPK